MKYPGQPKSPPGWYRDRGPSYIEKEFSKSLDDLADLIERERWFGDSEKHGRYRVDFILKDARLIIELDGHDYHSTKEQLERDAIRQRYLTRAGYSVIRFTGREVNRDPAACVAEVREMYRERMERSPAKYRALYLDYRFLMRQMSEALHFYRDTHPDKDLQFPTIEDFVGHAIEWLHERSFVTAFIFLPLEDAEELSHLQGVVKEYGKGEIRLNIVEADLYSIELGEHMQSFAHLFDEFYLVGDDVVYVEPFRSVLPDNFSNNFLGEHNLEFLAGGKLLRKGNHETAFVGTDLARVRWQDVCYPIGASMGLATHEL